MMIHHLPPPGQTLREGYCWDRHSQAKPTAQGAHRFQEGCSEEGSGEGVPGDKVQGRPGVGMLEGQPACVCFKQQVLRQEDQHCRPFLPDRAEKNSGKILRIIQIFLQLYVEQI